ncbi:barnase inhibitor [Paenibacillus sambharensis]|uniref:Barnase inhibitor n=1 Tax=Paenibacillus sambharensis TaxID=1803190 RepID=A0A2W1LFY5_9BACL|nr:barstar family protein [Paenibacillus sambharensis]PZD97609.1 barnase inhibitor [Paenibacillus sambharensis]
MAEELVLNGQELWTIDDFHDLFMNRLHFPGHYGRNLDALYDSLMDYVIPPLTIRWTHYNESEQLLGDRAQALVQVLRDAAAEVEGLEVIVEP